MRSSFNTQLARTLASIALLILLVACGSKGNTSTPTTPGPTPTATTAATGNPAPQLNIIGQQTINMHGLSIYSANGIQ